MELCGLMKTKNIYFIAVLKTYVVVCGNINGGGTRNRTEGQGFAIQCISHFAMPPKKKGIIASLS